jgi:Glycosyl transferases group 1/Glycosyltransferase Family 4
MKILMLGRWLPVARRGMEATREQRLARQLARSHCLTLAFITDDPDPAGAVSALREEFGDLEFAVVTRGWKTLSGAVSLATGNSATIAYARSAALGTRLRDRLRVESYDLICVTSSSMVQYALDAAPAVPIVMDFAEVDSRWWIRQARERSFPGANFYRTEAARLRLAEQAVARRAGRCIVSSAAAARWVHSSAGLPPTIVPNGVDVEHFIPALRMPGAPVVLFLSPLECEGDVAATGAFCRAMVPVVRRRHPGTRFLVVGRDLPPSARDLARIQGVEVSERVSDIRPVLHRATLAVAPLATESGPHTGILEAMCAGLPVVTTANGVAGLGTRPGRDLLVQDTAESFAGPVGELLGNPTLRAEIGGQAAAFVRARYAWDVTTAQLAEAVETAIPAMQAAAPGSAGRAARADLA